MGTLLGTGIAQSRLFARSVATPPPSKERKPPLGRAQRTGTGQGRLFPRVEAEPVFKTHGEKSPLRIVKVGKGGKLGGRHTMKPLQIALTPMQMEVLKPGKLIGCGFFGCAYTRTDDPNLVVKFTRDFTDIYGLQQGRGHGRIAQMKRAWKLQGRDIWAVTVERLQPVPDDFARMFTVLGMNVVGPWAQHSWETEGSGAGTRSYRLLPDARHQLHAACYQIGYPNPDVIRFCTAVGEQMFEVHEYLGRRKVRLTDFHDGNIGYDPVHRQWKMLDIGFSRTPEPTVDELAAATPERAHLWEV